MTGVSEHLPSIFPILQTTNCISEQKSDLSKTFQQGSFKVQRQTQSYNLIRSYRKGFTKEQGFVQAIKRKDDHTGREEDVGTTWSSRAGMRTQGPWLSLPLTVFSTFPAVLLGKNQIIWLILVSSPIKWNHFFLLMWLSV